MIEETYGTHFDQIQNDAADAVVTYWIGWWPELHVDVTKSYSADVQITVRSKIDILGSCTIESIDVQLAGLEDLTEEEADVMVQTQQQNTNQFAKDMVAFWGYAVMLAFFVLGITTMLPTPIADGPLASICVIVGFTYFFYCWTLVYALRHSALTQEQISDTFITQSLSLLLAALTFFLGARWAGGSFGRVLGEFGGNYGITKKGFAIRSNMAAFITCLLCLLMTLGIWHGVNMGWW